MTRSKRQHTPQPCDTCDQAHWVRRDITAAGWVVSVGIASQGEVIGHRKVIHCDRLGRDIDRCEYFDTQHHSLPCRPAEVPPA